MNNKKGFTCGAFDLLHAGHITTLKECRWLCRELIVGLEVDPNFDRPHKNKPIQTLAERRIQLEGVRYVDKVIVYNGEVELLELLNLLKPDIRFIGDDWRGKHFTGKEIESIEIFYNNRDHGYSTSELIRRIKEGE